MSSGSLVDNVAVRSAVEEFAAEPAAHTMLEVLRQCLHGELLLDATGSGFDPDGQLPVGASLTLASAQAPDGSPALLAFTSNEQVQRIHPGEQIQTLVQAGADVLALAHKRDGSWLYIDPGGPTCALAPGDLDFALRVPRNDKLHAAIAAVTDDPSRRPELLDALRTEGTLLLASATDPSAGDVELRRGALPDGEPALFAYTSGPEIAVGHLSDTIVMRTTTDVLAYLRTSTYQALVLNPAGPSVVLSRTELLG